MTKKTVWISVSRDAEETAQDLLNKYKAQKINTAVATTDLYSVEIENKDDIKGLESVFGSIIKPKYQELESFTYLDKPLTVKRVESVCINGIWEPAYITEEGCIYEHQLNNSRKT